MQASKWDLDKTTDNDAGDLSSRKITGGIRRSVRDQNCIASVVHSVIYRGYLVCEPPNF
jgi:hypothetical protein